MPGLSDPSALGFIRTHHGLGMQGRRLLITAEGSRERQKVVEPILIIPSKACASDTTSCLVSTPKTASPFHTRAFERLTRLKPNHTGIFSYEGVRVQQGLTMREKGCEHCHSNILAWRISRKKKKALY